jgi:hypothetical protein
MSNVFDPYGTGPAADEGGTVPPAVGGENATEDSEPVFDPPADPPADTTGT